MLMADQRFSLMMLEFRVIRKSIRREYMLLIPAADGIRDDDAVEIQHYKR